jgi:hypothetical protein
LLPDGKIGHEFGDEEVAVFEVADLCGLALVRLSASETVK